MVYAMSYKSRGASYPRAELIEGSENLVLEDYSPDGGAFLHRFENISGRRILSSSGPKIIRRFAKKATLLDYEEQFVPTVSERFRQLIESIEPGIHQFEPVRYIGREKEFLEDRWLFQCCNRLNSVDGERSNLRFVTCLWRPPLTGTYEIIFSSKAIGDVKFWYDKYKHVGLLVSDDARKTIEDARVSGVSFHHFRQI